ncbi:MAG TPA: protein kinase, partial [Anaerolineales bacterium]|nr:protein kinase [Anaerolineales bacterium]
MSRNSANEYSIVNDQSENKVSIMNDPTELTLGRYQIVSLVARGGMSEVFKAYQPGLDRYVAVKVLHAHLADEPSFIDRFEREAASVARLRHPNIVQVIDFDCQDGRYYMVMEFIEGASLIDDLEDRAERGETYTPQEAAYLISGVASALDYAHNRGMVHRDIKPANILFTGEGQVVLTDFGIAHIVGTTLYTENESFLGTPAYMSPEQACGSPGDASGDIYSLGVVLYQLLLGRLPFEADTFLGLIQQHLHAEPPRPREINPNLSEAVEGVVLKALAKTPEHRYQRAGELALDLLQAVGLTAEEVIGVGAFIRVYETPEKIGLATKPLPPCPYRGLFAFREEDAPFFFGREEFSDQLIEAVEDRSLVAVLGPSGSGKSSVVFAGLLPLLRQAAGLRAAQGYAWMIADCRPGADPFYSLATALLPYLEVQLSETDRLLETRKLATAMESGDLPTADLFHRLLNKNPERGRLLLVIDQFEELYTLCPSLDTQQRYVQALLKALENNPNITIILTLRADFLGQALSYRPLADALQYADLKLGPMEKWELVQAVENPARKLGVTFEAGLVERILDDVGEEPGNLPLLEFALTQLWEEQQFGQLSHATYEAIGRVQGALSRYADRVYADLNEGQREQARHIFTQMVRPGEGTVDTRRLAVRQELGEGHWALVQQLADARLVVTGRE